MQRNRQRQEKDSRQSSNFYLIQRHGFSLYISMKSVQNWRSSSVVQLVVSAADILTVGYGNLYWEMRPQSLLMCPHTLKRAWTGRWPDGTNLSATGSWGRLNAPYTLSLAWTVLVCSGGRTVWGPLGMGRKEWPNIIKKPWWTQEITVPWKV